MTLISRNAEYPISNTEFPMSKWALAILEAAVHSRDIVGWDDPFSDEGAWIVPAKRRGGSTLRRDCLVSKAQPFEYTITHKAASHRSVFACDSNRLLLAGTVTRSAFACRFRTCHQQMMPSKTTKHQSADRSTKMTVPPAYSFDVNTLRGKLPDGTIH